MKEKYPKHYKEFKCLGGSCPNTCCQGWGVDIDKNTLARYRNVDGPYGAKLKNILSNHKQFFKLGNSCPFLSKDGLCDIQLNLGEGYLCDVCRKFPREEYQYGEYIEHSLTPACINVAEMILKNMDFEDKISDRLVTTYSTFDTKFFPYMYNAREFIFDVLDTMKFDNGIMLILEFVEYIQGNFRVYTRIDSIVDTFRGKMNDYTDKFSSHITEKMVVKLIKEYMGLKMLTPYLRDKLDALLHMIYSGRIKISDIVGLFENYRNISQFANVAKYFVYKYYLRCVYDYSMASRTKFAIYTTFILMLLSVFDAYTLGRVDIKDIAKNLEMISREIEHNEDSIKKLNKFFKKGSLV